MKNYSNTLFEVAFTKKKILQKGKLQNHVKYMARTYSEGRKKYVFKKGPLRFILTEQITYANAFDLNIIQAQRGKPFIYEI